jgi:hypothetical protein
MGWFRYADLMSDLKKARALLRSGDYTKGQIVDELKIARHTLWVRLDERGRKGCFGPRRGESLFSRIGLLGGGVVDKACVQNKWKTPERPKTVRQEIHGSIRTGHYLRCYQARLQDTNCDTQAESVTAPEKLLRTRPPRCEGR